MVLSQQALDGNPYPLVKDFFADTHVKAAAHPVDSLPAQLQALSGNTRVNMSDRMKKSPSKIIVPS
jgi:hypothetical protein